MTVWPEEHFGDVLKEYADKKNMGYSKIFNVAEELFGDKAVPLDTVKGWLQGNTKGPRDWRRVIQMAVVLDLSEHETNRLLLSGKHHPLNKLRQDHRDLSDHELLSKIPVANPDNSRTVPRLGPTVNLPNQFVGRKQLLSKIKKKLVDSRGHRIVCLTGMPGVGKTTTVAYIEKEWRFHFPDGTLWADLSSLEPIEALQLFADAYEKDYSHIHNENDLSMRIRNILRRKRVLIVLENVSDYSKASLLFPSEGDRSIIITTRRRDLTDGVTNLPIEPYDEGESLDYFRQKLGDLRADEDDLKEIADILGHLPLALKLAGDRIKLGRGYPVTEYLALLREKDTRIDEFFQKKDKDDEDTPVRLSFNISYESLSNDLKGFFCGLSAFPGNSFSVKGAAAISAVELFISDRWLGDLYDLSLVNLDNSGRYYLHPLLRDYSLELGQDNNIQMRLINYYVDFALKNNANFEALVSEESNLVKTLSLAFEVKPTVELLDAVLSLYNYMRAKGRYAQFNQLLLKARDFLLDKEDPQRSANVLVYLGHIALKWGKTSQAESDYRDAISIIEACADFPQKSKQTCGLYTSLAAFLHRVGKFDEAKSLYLSALELAQESSEFDRMIAILANIGLLATDMGNYDFASGKFSEAIKLADEQKSELRKMQVLLNYGYLLESKGEYQLADAQYQKGLKLAEESGDSELKGWLLSGRCANAIAAQDLDNAQKYWAAGQKLAEDLKNQQLIGRFLAHEGRLAFRNSHPRNAKDRFSEAISLAREGGFRSDVCFTLIDLADTQIYQGELTQAKIHLKEALEIAEEAHLFVEENRVKFEYAKIAYVTNDLAEARRLAQDCHLALERMGNRYAIEVKHWLVQLDE